MRTPLSILSRGRLAGGIKKPLAMLAIGWLVTTGTPPIPPTPSDDAGRGYSNSYNKKEKEQREQEERIKIEDSEVIAIVELCLKIAII